MPKARVKRKVNAPPPRRVQSPGKVFRDPVHRLIRIAPEDEFLLDLIDTPEMQRMRRIRQLGVSWLTYHGAEHSRFVHSLGVLNFAQRIIASLQTRYGRGSEVFQRLTKHARTVKAAALLHDTGHAPFSHMLERAFGKSHHEARTIELILRAGSPVNDVLRRHQVDPESVASVIRKDFPDKLAVDIVSSQLDADRMDYLLRDSYCTGVGYGEFDADWLIHAMCIGKVGGAEAKDKLKLCLDQRRGVYAAERFVMARLHMYQQVYMHRVTRGFEVLALNLFKAAAYRATHGGLPKGTPEVVQAYFKNEGKLDPEMFARFDEAQVVASFHCWSAASKPADATIARLSRAFLNRERVYRSIQFQGSTEAQATLGVELDKLPKAEDKHTPRYKIDSFEDTPYKGVFYQAEQGTGGVNAPQSILLADPSEPKDVHVVETRSAMLKGLDASRFIATRLYFDRDLEKDVRGCLKRADITPTEG